METIESCADLSQAARAALRRRILGIADSKRLLGIRYSDWLLGAPSIETGIAASSMAQDEWGHARLLYAMLKDFDLDPVEIEHERDAAAYANIDALDEPLEDWADVVAAIVVVDGGLTAALAGLAEGAYEPARQRIPKMLAEEHFHRDLGRAWFARLADGSPEARGRLADAVERILPSTLAWLAPDDEAFGVLVEQGLCAVDEALVSSFRAEVILPLSEVDVDFGSAEPDRSDWDAERGRGPGEPDEDAVARARGDLNRSLFVE